MERISAPATNPPAGTQIPFPAWNLKNGAMNASDAQLDASSESCESWGWACGVLIVAGIAVQLFIAFTNPPYGSPWQQWGSIVAYLLVAFGVWGTIMFSLMQRSAQKELARRSKAKSDHADERVAQARESAAKSQASAAEAEKQAQELALKLAEAQLTLQRLSSPRIPDQRKFLKALMGQPRPAKIDVHYSTEGSDCVLLAAWTAKYLRDAGWPIEPEYPLAIPRSTISNMTATQVEGAQPWGITILAQDLQKSDVPARALLDALFDSIGSPMIAVVASGRIPTGHLRVVVGPKP